MIARATAIAIAFSTAVVLVVMMTARTPTAIACTGEPERFDDLVRAADVIAVVRAETVGGAVNSAPTIRPTFTPFPEATSAPYPAGDFTGIGATVKVFSVIWGADVEARIVADAVRRTEIEEHERSMESVWPGTAGSQCALMFQTRYRADTFYIALYKNTGEGFETLRLVKLDDDGLDSQDMQIGPGRGIGLNLGVYEQYFADIPAEITDYIVPEGEADHAYIREPEIPLDRFVAFIQSLRGVPKAISPPETGSGGLR